MHSDFTKLKIDGYNVTEIHQNYNCGAKHNLHLASANGFSVGCYSEFISSFSQPFSVTATDNRGAWPDHPAPQRNFTTKSFALDLICNIERLYSDPIIGMGHSHGGVVMSQAALLRPDLFKAVVIIDGATVPNRWVHPILRSLPTALVLKLFPFVRNSHQRQRIWNSREEFITRYQDHRTFKTFTPQAFKDYAIYGLRQRPSGDFELSFAPYWESHIFRSVGYLWSLLSNAQVPTLLIRAEHSNMYSQEQFDRRNQSLPKAVTPVTINGAGHLIPFETPQPLAGLITHWVEHDLGTR